MGYESRAQQDLMMVFGGLNTRVSELNISRGESPYMMNVDLHPVGSVKSRAGMTELDSPTGEAKIDAIMSLQQPENARGWLYCIADETIYRTPDPGAWLWEEALGLLSASYAIPLSSVRKNYGRTFARYNDGTEYPSCLFIPRGDGPPLIALGQVDPIGDLIETPLGAYGTGAVGSGTPGYPAEWDTNSDYPTHMRLLAPGRGARVHAWGFENDRNIVYYTELEVPWNYLRRNVDDPSLDPQSSVDGGFYGVNKGDGDEIISVVDMFSYTVIFKKFRTFIYTGDPGVESGTYEWRRVAEFPVGCSSDRAWTKVGNDILFWAKDGPRALSAVQEFGDMAQANLSFKITDLVANVTPDSSGRICCYHDIENMRVVWFSPLVGNSYNNSCYVFYYDRQIWAQWDGEFSHMMDVQVVDVPGSVTERIIGGSYANGLVLLQSGSADLEDVSGSLVAKDIESEYQTNWIQTGQVSDSTRVLWIDLFFGNAGGDVTIEYQTDLNRDWIPITRIIKAIGGGGTRWGAFKWNDGSTWNATGRSFVRYEMDLLFNLVRFRFSRTGQRGFEVMAYRIEARQKGARA